MLLDRDQRRCRCLTVVVNQASRSYGRANPTFTVRYAGFVPGQGPSVLSGALAFGTAAVPGSNVDVYAVQASGLASQNYSISYQPGVLIVYPAFLTFTAVNKVKSLKAHNPRLTFTESGFVLGQSAKKDFKRARAVHDRDHEESDREVLDRRQARNAQAHRQELCL